MAVVKKDNSYNPFGCDDGDYESVIVEVVEKEGKFNKNPFLLWSFKIKDAVRSGEYVDDVVVSGMTNSVPAEGQKFDKWLKACGVELEDGETFDTDELVGRSVKVIVENSTRKDGTPSCLVTKLLPIRIKPKRPGDKPERRQKPLERVKEDREDEDYDPEEQAILEEVKAKQKADKEKAAGKSKATSEKETATERPSPKKQTEKTPEEDLLDFADDKLGEVDEKLGEDDVPY